MNNNKLTQLLTTFNKKEQRRFKEFVASPYFNKQKDLHQYCIYLLDALSAKNPDKKIVPELIFKHLYPNQAFEKKQLNYLNNYLLRLAEKFIGWHHLEEQTNYIDHQTLDFFAQQRLHQHFGQKWKKLQESRNELIPTSEKISIEKYLLSNIAANEFGARQLRKYNPHLQEAADALDEFYWLNKLKHCCYMLTNQSSVTTEYHTPFLEEVKSYLSQNEAISVEIKVYLLILKILSDKNPNPHFFQLLGYLQSDTRVFNTQERKDIFLHAINFCARKIRKGEEPFVEEALQLYEKGIQEEVLFDSGYLSHWTYGNVVKLGLRLKRFDWTENFIHQHRDKLQEQYRENAFAFNISELYFYTKAYDKAQAQLTQVKFFDFYQILSRVMLIKIYYETEATEALISLIASFLMFLKRNKQFTTQVKKTYQNFCELLHQILRRKANRWEILKQEIENAPLLTDRSWLLKVLELEKARR